MIYKEFEELQKTFPYPSKNDIRDKVFKGFEDFVGTQAQINERRDELEKQVVREYREGQADYGRRLNQSMEAFAAALAEEYGVDNEQLAVEVYRLAYEDGHSGGLSEIESKYSDYAELALTAYSLGVKSVAA